MADARPVVLLFHPRTEHEENYRYFWIPYSVLSLAAMLHPSVDVRIVDENLEGRLSQKEVANVVQNCVCIGISSMTGRQIANGLQFAAMIRECCPEMPLIWGGSHPTLFAQEMLKSPLVDVVVMGPGEIPFKTLVSERIAGRSHPRIAGLAWLNREHLFHGGRAPARPSRDFPSFPWDLLPLERYVRPDDGIGTRTLNYVSSQGCPFPCGFCSEVALHAGKWNAFPPERIVEDAKLLIGLARINGLKLYDANFFVDVTRALRFSKLITPLGLRWAASCHPATVLGLDSEQLNALARSGLCRLLIGLESGAQGVLDLIHKRFQVDKMPLVAARLAEKQVVGSFTFIVGFPGVKDDLEATLRMGERIRGIWERHEIKVHFYAPYPGTPMWSDALRHGFIPPVDLAGWSEFDYYQVTTPWVDPGWRRIVRVFNQKHCPYVHP